MQQQQAIAGSRSEERFVSSGLQEQIVNASQGGMAGGTLHQGLLLAGVQDQGAPGGPSQQGLLLAGVQDQGGALAVAQLQALTLDEAQPHLSKQVMSSIPPSTPAAVATTCDPGVQSPLSWAEALGQLGHQVDAGGGWDFY